MLRDLRVRRGGHGAPTLLLLHGLGATSDVWDGWSSVLDERWPGSWLAPDLPGHGGSEPLSRYTFGAVAACVADLVSTDEQVVVLGHSMGGVVGLTLASGWFGPQVDAAIGLGIKVQWSEEEVTKGRQLADRPARSFPTRQEAAARYLRVAGLGDLLGADDPAVAGGLLEADGQWRLAQDPSTFAVGAPDMSGLLAAARGPVLLARGEYDPMVTDDQLTALDPAAIALAGLGHNAHVEAPDQVAGVLLAPYVR